MQVKFGSPGKTIQRQVSFINGKADGVSTTYSQNGKIETEKGFKIGVEDGHDRRYSSETGKVTSDTYYKDGKYHGIWTEYTSGNTGDYIRLSSYDNGVPVGEYSETEINTGEVRIKGRYKDGKKDGEWVDNRSRTGKKTYKYENGDKIEECSYFTDGKISKSVAFLNGKRNGVTKEYFFDTGKLKSEFTYKNGLENGVYKRYYDDGTLREEGLCENNSAISCKEYYTNGKLKSIAERKGGGGWITTHRFNSRGNLE